MNLAESENSSAPIANKQEHVHNDHGLPREDPYFWLKNREDPQVIKYLKEEKEKARRDNLQRGQTKI